MRKSLHLGKVGTWLMGRPCVFCFHSLNAVCFIRYIFMVPEIGVPTEFKERNFVFV